MSSTYYTSNTILENIVYIQHFKNIGPLQYFEPGTYNIFCSIKLEYRIAVT